MNHSRNFSLNISHYCALFVSIAQIADLHGLLIKWVSNYNLFGLEGYLVDAR